MDYLNIINPKKLFKSESEVHQFIKIDCTIKDLECFLDACEEQELYEYCVIIKREIDDRLNQNRTGIRPENI
jgi:hypothetical protein